MLISKEWRVSISANLVIRVGGQWANLADRLSVRKKVMLATRTMSVMFSLLLIIKMTGLLLVKWFASIRTKDLTETYLKMK